MDNKSGIGTAQKFGRAVLLSAAVLFAPAAVGAATPQNETASIETIKTWLQRLSETSESRLQRVATAAIADIATHRDTEPQAREKAFITLAGLLGHYDKDVRDIAVGGIGRTGVAYPFYAKSAYSIILDLTNKPGDLDIGLAGISTEHFGKLGAASKELSVPALEKLEEVLQTYSDLSIQAQAIKGISRIGIAHESLRQRAVDDLRTVTENREKIHSYLRATARSALGDIAKASNTPAPAP